jgi:hypothetical protein
MSHRVGDDLLGRRLRERVAAETGEPVPANAG